MTVRRDYQAGCVVLLAQCDQLGVLRDFSRLHRSIIPNDLASDPEQLFGVDSFSGQPAFSGGSVFATTFTIEGYAKFNPNGATQSIFGAAATTYYRSTEFVISLTGARSFDIYNGVRGSSETHGSPVFPVDLPDMAGGFKHFFFCGTPGGCWIGIDGVMSGQFYLGFVSDHVGHVDTPIRLNNVDPALVNQPNQGKLHSLMVSSGVLRYPFSGSGVYTKPDDLLTNWYNDQGDPPSVENTLYNMRRPSYFAASRFRGSAARIAGHVTYSGANARKRVALYERRSGALVAQTFSRALDGAFEFAGLSADSEYFVVGFDDSPGTINAEVSDHLVPE